MSDLATFGDPARFEIGLRWAADSEPRSRLPAAHGWSMGDVRIVVAGQTLTRSQRGAATQRHASWYLAPFFQWLAASWPELFHEEDFAWRDTSGAPAAVACRDALASWITADDEEGRASYRAVQSWYRRHGLRAASEGGLFPDVFIRRLVDDIEISWTAAPPLFAPDGFFFASEPGVARLPVADVAGPLWEALSWCASVPPADLNEVDRERWAGIASEVDRVRTIPTAALEAVYLPPAVHALLGQATSTWQHSDLLDSLRLETAPVLVEFSPAVAMFGGVSPDLYGKDVQRLLGALADAHHGGDSERMAALVEERSLSPLGVPHKDGLSFAEDLLEELGLPGESGWIDIHAIAELLGVMVEDASLETTSVRGVALAGRGFRPTILVNTSSIYNSSEGGRRFTMAHELCHILYDRSRARRIAHVSGPWVAQGFERRANAFAAYFLMPRSLVIRHLGHGAADDAQAVRHVAQQLRMNETALVEHLFNLKLIGDWQREGLRRTFRPN